MGKIFLPRTKRKRVENRSYLNILFVCLLLNVLCYCYLMAVVCFVIFKVFCFGFGFTSNSVHLFIALNILSNY